MVCSIRIVQILVRFIPKDFMVFGTVNGTLLRKFNFQLFIVVYKNTGVLEIDLLSGDLAKHIY